MKTEEFGSEASSRARNTTLIVIAAELRDLGYRARTHKNKIRIDDGRMTLVQKKGTIIKLVDGWGSATPPCDIPLVGTFDLADPTSLDGLFQTIDRHYPVGGCHDDEDDEV